MYFKFWNIAILFSFCTRQYKFGSIQNKLMISVCSMEYIQNTQKMHWNKKIKPPIPLPATDQPSTLNVHVITHRQPPNNSCELTIPLSLLLGRCSQTDIQTYILVYVIDVISIWKCLYIQNCIWYYNYFCILKFSIICRYMIMT